MTPDEFQQGGVGVTGIAPSVTIVAGLAMEVIITFVLVLTVCGVCDSLRNDVKGKRFLWLFVWKDIKVEIDMHFLWVESELHIIDKLELIIKQDLLHSQLACQSQFVTLWQ